MVPHSCTPSCNHKYFSIHNHSIFSSRDCLSQIEEIYKKAQKDDFEVVITDHGNAGAWVEASKTAAKYGRKFIAGCEFYVNSDRKRYFELMKNIAAHKNTTPTDKKAKEVHEEELRKMNFEFDALAKYGHILAIAKNLDGYHELLQIHNNAFVNYFYKKPLTDYSDYFALPKNKDGTRNVILTSACLANQINQYILRDETGKAESFAEMMKEEFPYDFYLEVQTNGLDMQKKCNSELLRIGKKYKIPVSIANDAHYTSAAHSEAHQVLLLLQGDNKISDRDKMVWQITYETKKGETRRKKIEEGGDFFGFDVEQLVVGDRLYKKDKTLDEKKYDKIIKKKEKVSKAWIIEAENLVFCNETELRKKAEEHVELHSELDNILKTNSLLLERIESYSIDTKNKLPRFPDEVATLKRLCATAMAEKGLAKNKEYVDRLKYELRIITSAGFSSYFLILYDVYKYAKENNIPRGVSRGSAGACLVAYLLGITMIDPVEFRFPFARFLNLERLGMDLVNIKMDNGKKLMLFQDDPVVVVRGGEKKTITASQIVDGDDLIEYPKEF